MLVRSKIYIFRIILYIIILTSEIIYWPTKIVQSLENSANSKSEQWLNEMKGKKNQDSGGHRPSVESSG